MHADEFGEAGHAQGGEGWGGHDHASHSPSLDLGEEERLPWLESAEDIDAEPHRGSNSGLIAAGAAALLVLGLLVSGIYWFTHRGAPSLPADGSLIEASKEPYKIAPSDPGGKQFAGTGDESFKVSQGQHPDASLAGSTGTTPPPAAPAPTASAAPAPAATPTPAPVAAKAAAPEHASVSGVPVQIGAYSSNSLAEAAWSHMSGAHELLKGLNHRVVEGRADIGTVYRLQAMAADGSAANSLCSKLEGEGVKCQVKR